MPSLRIIFPSRLWVLTREGLPHRQSRGVCTLKVLTKPPPRMTSGTWRISLSCPTRAPLGQDILYAGTQSSEETLPLRTGSTPCLSSRVCLHGCVRVVKNVCIHVPVYTAARPLKRKLISRNGPGVRTHFTYTPSASACVSLTGIFFSSSFVLRLCRLFLFLRYEDLLPSAASSHASGREDFPPVLSLHDLKRRRVGLYSDLTGRTERLAGQEWLTLFQAAGKKFSGDEDSETLRSLSS